MSLDNETPARVTRDGNTLVAAYPSANPPLVWKFNLDHYPSFVFILQGQEGHWELGINTARNEFYPVARFRSREDAEDAFDATQSGLLKSKASPWRTACMYLIPATVILLLLVWLLLRVVEQPRVPVAGIPGTASVTSATPQLPAPKPLKEGVPMSADEVLKPPAE